MSTTELACVAGRFVPADEAAVPLNDGGVLQGVGLFETLRTYGGRPFRLPAHLARLRGSGRFLGIAVRETDQRIAEIVAHLVEVNGAQEARVRITAIAGAAPESGEGGEAPAATLMVTARPLAPYPPRLYQEGASVVLSALRLSGTDPTVCHKTISRLRNVIALREARRAGAVEAIFLNTEQRLAEGAISNVFVVRKGRLVTPPVEEGLLPGITRAVVLELAAEMGLVAAEEAVAARELLDAEEVFLTNSIMEVLPVGRMDGRPMGDGRPGPVARRLSEAYRALVARETGA